MSPLNWTIVCDFDGTVTPEDVTDEILARFAKPEWLRVEAAWRAGIIGSRTCMEQQVGLLDCNREELDAFLAGVDIDPHFPAFVAAAATRGARLVIASDGLDQVCRSILQRHGLGHLPVFANRLVQVASRQWRLDFPHAAIGCSAGHCKCARATHGDGERLLVIGDGASDFCAARRADLVFARGALREHCAACGIPHEAVRDFSDALRLLSLLRDRAPDAALEGDLR